MHTGQTAARDPQPGDCISVGHAGLDLKCESFTESQLVLHVTPRLNFGWLRRKRGLLFVVLTLVVTIATDASSIVERSSESRSRALCGHGFLACLICCGRARLSLLCLGHIVSIIGLLLVLRRHRAPKTDRFAVATFARPHIAVVLHVVLRRYWPIVIMPLLLEIS